MMDSHDSVAPMNRTRRGPICRIQNDELLVDYDYEDEDGTASWSRLIFSGVLAIEYRQAVSCRSEDIASATEVRKLETSAWLSAVLDRWQDNVGWHELQKQFGGARRFKHYTAFFDDAGCVNVVATKCTSIALGDSSRAGGTRGIK